MVERTLDVYASLADFQARPVRIHLVDAPLPPSSAGVTLEREDGRSWILVRRGDEDLLATVAHELAHFFFAEFQRALPAAVQEGVCEELSSHVADTRALFRYRVSVAAMRYLDAFQVTVNDASGKELLARLLKPMPTPRAALELSPKALFESGDDVRDGVYGLGWTIVRLVGIERLRALAARARASGEEQVPIDWILTAADLVPADQAHLRAAFLRSLGEADGGGLPAFSIGHGAGG